MNFIIRKIINIWKENDLIKDDEEIYVYGLKLFFSESSSFLTVLILSLIFNRFVNGILYLVSFTMLRKYSGGYHAKTYLHCYISFVLIYMLSEVFSRFIMPNTAICIFLFSSLIIFLLAPVDTERKRISKRHRKKARRTIKVGLIVLFLLELALIVLRIDCGVTLSLVLAINAALIIIQYVINLEVKEYEKI